MKKAMPPLFTKGAKTGKKSPMKPKSDEGDMLPEGDAAEKRADRPARKAGGSVKKKGC